jgi:hypothetical protein
MTKASIQLGSQAIKQIYERALLSKHIDSVCLSSNYEAVLGDWFDATYAARLYDGTRTVREVLPESIENRDAAKIKPQSCSARFVTGDRSETDLMITNTWAALVSYTSDSAGVVVFEDEEALKLFRRLFEASWVGATE